MNYEQVWEVHEEPAEQKGIGDHPDCFLYGSNAFTGENMACEPLCWILDEHYKDTGKRDYSKCMPAGCPSICNPRDQNGRYEFLKHQMPWNTNVYDYYNSPICEGCKARYKPWLTENGAICLTPGNPGPGCNGLFRPPVIVESKTPFERDLEPEILG